MDFLRSAKGGITVFQCIVFTALFFLSGVLVDVSRIMVAERKVQSALNSSVRSTLAKYDEGLIGDYGLFGVDTASDENKIQEDFLKYLELNLKERTNNFKFIDYEIETMDHQSGIEGFNSLLDEKCFKNQIMEYMKYKAPISITQGVVQKFLSSGIFRKLKFSKSEKEVRNEQRKLKKQVVGINEKIGTVQNNINQGSAGVEEAKKLLEKAKEENSGISEQLKKYMDEKSKSDEIAATKDLDELMIDGSGIIENKEEFPNLLSESQTLGSAMNINIQKLEVLFSQIKALGSQISALEDQGSSEEDSEESDERQTQIDSLNARISELQNSFKLDEMKALSIETDGEIGEKEDPEAENKANGLLEGIKKKFDAYLKNIDSSELIPTVDFQNATREAEIDQEDWAASGLADKNDESEAEKKNDGIIAFLSNIANVFTDAARLGMEKLYIIEYVMDKNTYVTSKTERAHYFEKGEVEYIIWGGNNQLGNISKTMGSIWFLRFAIDAIDSFAISLNPVPIFRLIGALIKGFTLSCTDVFELFQGREISLCPSMKNAIKLTYEDHLRVFLLLEIATSAGETAILNNIRQLVQLNLKQSNAKFTLKNQQTILKGKTVVKINLWFLPLLQIDKMGFKNFQDGKYIISKEATSGY